MRRAPLVAALLALALLSAACATTALRNAKNAYNRGDFAVAQAAAGRAAGGAAGQGDAQAHLIAARAATRLVPPGQAHAATLAAIAADLRAAARGWPFAEEWAGGELAAGIGDWLMLAELPELAGVYYRAALEEPGEEIDPARAAAAEGLIQAGLEAAERWEPSESERAAALRDLERAAGKLLDDSGWPYPPGLADQALRVAWHRGDHRAAWTYAAAGWLRAVAVGDVDGAAVLDSRLTELVFPDWRAASDPARVDALEAAWRRAQRAWFPSGLVVIAGGVPAPESD